MEKSQIPQLNEIEKIHRDYKFNGGFINIIISIYTIGLLIELGLPLIIKGFALGILIILWTKYYLCMSIISQFQYLSFIDSVGENKLNESIIDDIQDKTHIIQKTFSYILILIRVNNKYLNLGSNFLLEKTMQYLLYKLYILKYQLNNSIDTQKTILESAKSEVEKNIAGTTELESVSELQRARLDRQIEQFEELQRVLVKV